MLKQIGAVLAGAALLSLVPASAGGAPPGGPPRSGAGGPPPAWIAVGKQARWLAYSGYCWDTTCVRVRSPAQRTDIPRVAAAHGRLARVHFGFAARQISVSALNEQRPVALAPGRTVSWLIRQTGFVVISATAPGRGTVSYAVNVR